MGRVVQEIPYGILKDQSLPDAPEPLTLRATYPSFWTTSSKMTRPRYEGFVQYLGPGALFPFPNGCSCRCGSSAPLSAR